MPRGVKKEHLPSKTCVVCNRPFTWRKKWESVWDEVTTCSKSCNRQRKEARQRENKKVAAADNAYSSDTTESVNEQENSQIQQELISTEQLAKLILDDGDSDSVGSTDTSSHNGEDVATNHKAAAHDNENEDNVDDSSTELDPKQQEKAARKAAKKLVKAQKRAQREGRADPEYGQKTCDLCQKSVDLLIRCQIDETEQWKMVCGKCWNVVSGGVVDGDDAHPYYKYGGLWKNRKRK